jgi:hypothetical protein
MIPSVRSDIADGGDELRYGGKKEPAKMSAFQCSSQ